MTKTTKILTILLASSAAISTGAQADIFTDTAVFNAANSGLTSIDFEGIAAPGGFTGNSNNFFTALGVELSTPNNLGARTIIGGQGGAFGLGSDSLITDAFGASIEIGFTNDVSVVGFNVAMMDYITFTPGSVIVDVFSGGTLLATESFATSSFNPMSSFIGFSNLGANITSIVITPTSTNFTQLAIDNLSFGTVQVVPVPTAAIAGLAMLGSLGAYRRIRS